MKTAWLLLGFWIGRHIFRRRPLPGPASIERMRELGGL